MIFTKWYRLDDVLKYSRILYFVYVSMGKVSRKMKREDAQTHFQVVVSAVLEEARMEEGGQELPLWRVMVPEGLTQT